MIPNFLIKIGITKVLFFESYFKKIKVLFLFEIVFKFLSFTKFKLDNYEIEKKNI